MEENHNKGRRQRLRDRYIHSGLSELHDHEVLELLLYYALVRADTNRIAHALIKRFGDLSAVLDAGVEGLQQVSGVGEQAAVLISMQPSLSRRYLHDRVKREQPILNSSASVAEYLKPLFIGRRTEVFYLLCLDSRLRVTFPALVSRGTVKDAYVHPRKVVELALRHQASSVILAHNHPSGHLQASDQDKVLTKQLVQALGLIDIPVLDHIIVADNQTLSFAESSIMPTFVA
ncbi:MAG: DNA repair protein RadC [Saprospiraceae bacterium]|jgi:DNA repair protein RadC